MVPLQGLRVLGTSAFSWRGWVERDPAREMFWQFLGYAAVRFPSFCRGILLESMMRLLFCHSFVSGVQIGTRRESRWVGGWGRGQVSFSTRAFIHRLPWQCSFSCLPLMAVPLLPHIPVQVPGRSFPWCSGILLPDSWSGLRLPRPLKFRRRTIRL